MAQPSTNSDGVPLFACTKCNSRHPFEDLSQGHHLCKDCRGSFQVIKCNYCRDEFHQELNKGKTSSICKKCEQLQEQHGKPGPCAFCNIIAAFIGTKCQRCTNSEKKYGAPMPCEHCRQKCAFDRKDPESKKKVDGKLLCWLCTMAYKRTLAKARHKEAMLKSMASGSSANLSPKYSSSSFISPKYSSSDWSSFDSHSSSHQRNKSKSSSVQSNKKQRLDHSSTNGQHHHHHHHMSSSNNHLTASIQSTNETRSNDSSNKDLVAVVTQLKDQVANLNKRLIQKEKELLAKDQQIADLRSTNTREQREFREKMNTVQKQHTERVSELQAKLVSMQKQIVSHNKGTKATANPSSYVEPPLAM